MGDRIVVLGQEFAVSGLSGGTSNMFNPLVFLRLEDVAALAAAAAEDGMPAQTGRSSSGMWT